MAGERGLSRAQRVLRAVRLTCVTVTSDRKSHIWQNLWLDSITDSIDVNLSRFQGIVEERRAWRAAVHGVTKSQTPLSH